MKNIKTLLLFGLIVMVISCSKKSTDPSNNNTTPKSTFDMLIGKWDVVREASDENHNGKMDDSELEYRNKDLHYVFEKDGTGGMIYMASGTEHTDSYTWKLYDKDIVLNNGTKMADTLHIELITDTGLRYRRKWGASYDDEWKIYVKN